MGGSCSLWGRCCACVLSGDSDGLHSVWRRVSAQKRVDLTGLRRKRFPVLAQVRNGGLGLLLKARQASDGIIRIARYRAIMTGEMSVEPARIADFTALWACFFHIMGSLSYLVIYRVG